MFVYLVNIVNHIGSFKRFSYYIIIIHIRICSSFSLYNYCDKTEKNLFIIYIIINSWYSF